jgi:hypothetical protein
MFNLADKATFATWFRIRGDNTTPTNQGDHTFISKMGENSFYFYYRFSNQYLSLYAFGLTASIGNAVSVQDGKWHHAAVTYDGAKLIMYLDGAQVGARRGDGQLQPDVRPGDYRSNRRSKQRRIERRSRRPLHLR